MTVSVFIGVGNHALTHRYPMGEITPEQESIGKIREGSLMKVVKCVRMVFDDVNFHRLNMLCY